MTKQEAIKDLLSRMDKLTDEQLFGNVLCPRLCIAHIEAITKQLCELVYLEENEVQAWLDTHYPIEEITQ